MREVYDSGKEFVYDHLSRNRIYTINRGTDTKINITVNTQRRSMKGLLLSFVEPYVAGTRDSEKYIFLDLKKISFTINGSPNMLYNNGHRKTGHLDRGQPLFYERKTQPQHMTLEKFYTKNKFGLLTDLRSMASQEMAWQRHPFRKHHGRHPAGNRSRRQGNRNC